MIEETILIGNQIWTTENISITNFRNGDIIIESKNQKELEINNKQKIPTWHYKDFDKDNLHHGLYYNFYVLNDYREILPFGWLIPSKHDWEVLLSYCGYLKDNEMTYLDDSLFDFFNLRAISELKSSKGWSTGKHKGNNFSGFNAMSDNNGKLASWIIKENNKLEIVSLGSKLRSPISVKFEKIDNAKSYCIRLIKKNFIKEVNSENGSVKIANLEWSTSNLCAKKFNNGDDIPLVTSEEEWIDFGKAGKPACCYYNNNEENMKFGLLYNYFALIDKRGLAPKGFRLASMNDWLELKNDIGNNTSDFLNIMSNKFWNRVFITGKRFPGTNSTKFNAIPAGIRRLVYIASWEGEAIYKSCFANMGNYSYWWTADGHSVYLGFSDGIEGESEYPEFKIENTKATHLDYLRSGLTVRCVKL